MGRNVAPFLCVLEIIFFFLSNLSPDYSQPLTHSCLSSLCSIVLFHMLNLTSSSSLSLFILLKVMWCTCSTKVPKGNCLGGLGDKTIQDGDLSEVMQHPKLTLLITMLSSTIDHRNSLSFILFFF